MSVTLVRQLILPRQARESSQSSGTKLIILVMIVNKSRALARAFLSEVMAYLGFQF